MVPMRVTANGIRTIEHNGGIDAWLLGTRDSRLGTAALKIKKLLLRMQNRKKAA